MITGKVFTQVRRLSLHEYQSLEVFKKYQVPVPRWAYVTQPERMLEEARKITSTGSEVVVKAQVLAGGRGLGTFKNGFKGGVHLAKTAEEARDLASKMIGQTLVTKQTGAVGKPCNGVLVVEKFDIKAEKYFAILMDRGSGGPVLIGSKFGGMNIEDVARDHPNEIHKYPVDINKGLSIEGALWLADKMGFQEAHLQKEVAHLITSLYEMFIKADSTLIEVNPLVELKNGHAMICDAKLTFDDNAAFRQKDIHGKRDFSQEDPREVEAHKWDLNYIGLDGEVGCMVNGAGLAMATMDLLSFFGGSPANFLDVGGSAQAEQIKAAFGILEEDPKVKSILVNIFGGIMRCDVVAEGVVAASKELKMSKPIVIRLVGTNVEKGKKIIKDSGLKLEAFDDLNQAAQKAVALAKANSK